MYWCRSEQSLETNDEMEANIPPVETEEQFLTRMGSLPIVTAALAQLWTIYSRTKESNGLVKSILESAETGAKVAIATAQPVAKPVLNSLERPIGSLNVIAGSQLTKLEEAYPIITKPADQVLEGTLNLCKSTVDNVCQKTVTPSVEKIAVAKKYGAEKVSAVKQCGYEVIENTCGKLISAHNYGQEKITGVAEYGLTSLDYGHKTVVGILEKPYAQNVLGKIDGLLDVADEYVEHYLPAEDKEDKADPDEKEKAEVQAVDTPSAPSVLADINKTEDSKTTTATDTALERDVEEIVTGQRVDNVILKRQVIANARNLNARLKGQIGYLATTVQVLPETIQERASQARQFSGQLYNQASTSELKVADIPQVARDLVRSQVATAQDSLTNVGDYLADNKTLQWLAPVQVRAFLGRPSVVEEKSSVRGTPEQEAEETLDSSENLNTSTFLPSDQDTSFNYISREDNMNNEELTK